MRPSQPSHILHSAIVSHHRSGLQDARKGLARAEKRLERYAIALRHAHDDYQFLSQQSGVASRVEDAKASIDALRHAVDCWKRAEHRFDQAGIKVEAWQARIACAEAHWAEKAAAKDTNSKAKGKDAGPCSND